MASTVIVRQWLFLAAALLILGGVISWNLHSEYQATEARERERLDFHAKIVDEILERQLLAMSSVLNTIRNDLPHTLSQKNGPELVSRRLTELSMAMNHAHTLFVLDAQGVAIASSRKEILGVDLSQRRNFQVARQTLDPEMLQISTPFLTNASSTIYALSIGKTILNAKQEFTGAVFGTLDPGYAGALMNTLRYAPDMRATILHADGTIFLKSPPVDGITGKVVARSGTPFGRHLDSKQKANVIIGQASTSDQESMVILRTIKPASLAMDHPLVLAVARNMSSIFAVWRSHAYLQLGLLAALALISTLVLNFYQQRQRKYNFLLASQMAERKRTEAQLIELEKRHAALFVSTTDAMMITDANGIVEDVNTSFTSVFGYEQDVIRGTFIEDLHPEAELASIRRNFAATAEGLNPPPLHTIIFHKEGRTMDVEIRASMTEIAGRKVIQGIFIDLAERHRLDQQHLDRERAHLTTLVREVHHRIKNNLQSVAGLLQRELGKFIELNPRLEAAITQVNAIAAVHGLQSSSDDEVIGLLDIIQSICNTASSLSQRAILFKIEPEEASLRQVQIEKDEAVAVALIVNELILNAVKHAPESDSRPTVSLRMEAGCAQLVIRNAQAATSDFNIDTGKGIGTGLSLVRALLPEQGAQLHYELDSENFLVTILKLSPPVVTTFNAMEIDESW